MPKSLVIVESPAKARTIEKFLGKDYSVVASMGHIRDLPKSKLGVDTEHDFQPTYTIPRDKAKTVKDLKAKADKCTEVILATDEDREGEAIAWHVAQAVGVSPADTKRVVFHEVTKTAILKALASPRLIDMPKVDAQQARRILDRLVGYELSPFLWKKVMPGLSAGRVQSVAVRLVVEREAERDAFVVKEYWSVDGQFVCSNTVSKGKIFGAQLHTLDGVKVEIITGDQANDIETALQTAIYQIASVERKERQRNPTPPFTTSTLQQEAARKLGFSAKKTMYCAQQLYEGVDVGSGRTGLITYMRTDSLNLAAEAVTSIRTLIGEKYGKDYVPVAPKLYHTKAKGAQEAHEAIRPTDITRLPESVKDALEKDLFRLYELIWKRAIACQMAPAVLDQTSADIVGVLTKSQWKQAMFRATGSVVKFPGFLAVYEEGKDDETEKKEGEDKRLPHLEQGESVDLDKLTPEQHFTQPPPRFTEATLVKALEEHGIGRPSTYAPTLSTIQDRGYVKLENKRFAPEDVGKVVTTLLVEHFPDVVDIDFTARMEQNLDDIAEGGREWVPVIREFYEPFHRNLTAKTEEVQKRSVVDEKTDEVCEKCGKPMIIRLGRFGKFLACSGYPDCRNTKPMESEIKSKDATTGEESTSAQKSVRDEPCEKCGGKMVLKRGRFGQFWGCEKYPECKNIQNLFVPKPTGAKCPDCGADIVTKRTKRGKIFYGCGSYPTCKYATWTRPEAATGTEETKTEEVKKEGS